MNRLVLIIELILFAIIALLGIYDWFYMKGLRQTSNNWGIIFPKKIEQLVVLGRNIMIISLLIMLIIIIITLANP